MENFKDWGKQRWNFWKKGDNDRATIVNNFNVINNKEEGFI